MAKNRKYGKTIAMILIALVVVIGVVMAVRAILGAKHETADNRPVVQTMAVQKRNIEVYAEQIGKIAPAEYVSVLPMISGEILSVNFKAGDSVRKGDLLCTIKSDNLDSLKIQLESAEIQKNDAATALSRVENLYAAGAVSQQALEQAQSASKGANLSYDNAKRQYDLMDGYANVTAPIDGVIESGNAEVHAFSSPQSPICTISAAGDVSVSFGVSGRSAETLKPGDSVTVENGSEIYTAKVEEVGSMVGYSGLHDVKATVEGGENLITGSRVKVTVIKEKAENVMTVPMPALYHSGNDAFVYVFENNTAVKRDIETGISDEEFIEVKSGLNGTENIIYTWSREIYNGAEVLLKED